MSNTYPEDEDDEPISLNTGAEPSGLEPGLGPDERDMDLMDGSWEQEYYSNDRRTRNWGAITVALGLLVVMGMLLPMLGGIFTK